MCISFKLHPLGIFHWKHLKKRFIELAVRVGTPQEVNFQKINFTSETDGVVSQHKLIEELIFYESGHSNEEEHQKNDYAVVDDSDSPVE